MDRAQRWLQEQVNALGDHGSWGPPEHAAAMAFRARAGLDALVAASAVAEQEADGWRARLTAGTDRPAPEPASADVCAAAEELLEELLGQLAADPEAERWSTIDGALALLGAAGAADAADWDARARAAAGEPSREEEEAEFAAMNAGGTNVDLVAVLPGPPRAVQGHRLALVLRFADGVLFVLEREPDAPEPSAWELLDDLGGELYGGASSGSETGELVEFRSIPAADAAWMELRSLDDPRLTFRVTL